jgi:murein DD-endopeptidase MepM/ murein hydrolase activator NlpD
MGENGMKRQVLLILLVVTSVLTLSTCPPLALASSPDRPFISPVQGDILVDYLEPYRHKLTGKRYLHRGIDIQAKKGQLVVASADGTVSFVGRTPAGGGATISIVHARRVKTTYLNLEQVKVVQGQKVSQGQEIGRIGENKDASSDQTHLHFGMIINGRYVDPKLFLKLDLTDISKYISLTDVGSKGTGSIRSSSRAARGEIAVRPGNEEESKSEGPSETSGGSFWDKVYRGLSYLYH